MSYVFEVLFLFWFVVISLLSSWYEIDVPVKLLTDDAWASEEDKTVFLSVVVDILIDYICKDGQYSCPGFKLVIKNKNMINEDKWEIWKNQKSEICFDE